MESGTIACEKAQTQWRTRSAAASRGNGPHLAVDGDPADHHVILPHRSKLQGR